MSKLSGLLFNFILTKDQLLDLFLGNPQKITASGGKTIEVSMFERSNAVKGSGVTVHKCRCLITHERNEGFAEGVVIPTDDEPTYACSFNCYT